MEPGSDLYGYGTGWTNTRFTRSVYARFVDSGLNIIRVEVTVSWQPVGRDVRTFKIYENMYRWVDDDSLSIDP